MKVLTWDGTGTIVIHKKLDAGRFESRNGIETDYVYDGKDQLRRATKTSNGVVQGSEEYWYDGNGKRIVTVKRDAAGDKTEMVWWCQDGEAHYDGSGSNTVTYSNIAFGAPVARVARVTSNAPLEYEFHGLGNSTLAAIDSATGNVNASFSYAPLGEVIEATDGGGSNGLESHKRKFNNKVSGRY